MSETHIVWFDPHNVYIYSFKEGKIVEKINSENLINYPKVNEKFIVWEEKLQNESKLFLKLIGDNQKPTLLLNENLFFYDIGKSYVVWQSDHLISAYSTILNKAQVLGKNGTLPYIQQNTVVWEHERNKGNNVIFKVVKLKDEF